MRIHTSKVLSTRWPIPRGDVAGFNTPSFLLGDLTVQTHLGDFPASVFWRFPQQEIPLIILVDRWILRQHPKCAWSVIGVFSRLNNNPLNLGVKNAHRIVNPDPWYQLPSIKILFIFSCIKFRRICKTGSHSINF